MIIVGIALGVAAAFSQSVSYLCSRYYMTTSKSGKMIELLIVSHIIMGIFSLFIIPFSIPEKLPPLTSYLPSMLGIAFCYLAGQASLFMALKKTEASKITPLLGIKLILLSVISLFLLNMTLSYMQMWAIGITVFAALIINWSRDKIALSSIFWILLACLFYSLSDINIRLFNSVLGDDISFIKKVWFSVSTSYIICGLFSLALSLFYKNRVYNDWKKAIPFSVTWFIAMIFLFSCFACIDVIHGNIVQSTRGIISVILGYIVSKLGFLHIEDKVNISIWIKRVIAALLMLSGIILYQISKQYN